MEEEIEYTILMVDDDPNLLEGLCRSLIEEPYDLLTAESGKEALELLEQHDVDVVISDERMPGMSGSELLSVVRERYPNTVRIILTGQASLDAAVRAINEGEIYRFLTKPCARAELLVTLKQALQVKRLTEESQRLLRVAQQQRSVLTDLEDAHPGITKVNRGSDGRITIDDEDLDLDQLAAEISREIAALEV